MVTVRLVLCENYFYTELFFARVILYSSFILLLHFRLYDELIIFCFEALSYEEMLLAKNSAIPAAVQRVPMAISFRTKITAEPRMHSALEDSLGQSNRPGKRKKTWTRAVFSNLQRKGLERSFNQQQYISKKDRRKLAATLGLTDSQVRQLSNILRFEKHG